MTKWLKRILITLILIIAILCIAVLFVYNSNWAQSKLSHQILNSLNEEYGTQMHLDSLEFNTLDDIILRNVLLVDHQKDTLIYSQKVEIDLDILDFALGKYKADKIVLSNGIFKQTTYKSDSLDNWTIFVDKFGEGSGGVSPSIEGDIVLDNMRVKIYDFNSANSKTFDANKIYGYFSRFSQRGRTTKMKVDSLRFQETEGFNVKKLSGDFRINNNKLSLINGVIQTDRSNIIGDVLLEYPDYENLNTFEEVEWSLDLAKSKIGLRDILTVLS